VKQTAWLQTAPNPPKSKPGKQTNTEPPKATMTRLEQIESQGLAPDLPPPGPAAHLFGYLFEAGPVGYAAMGPVPLSHTEIAAWQSNTGIELAAWEAKALRKLSADYVQASSQASEHDCPAFYIADPEAADRRQVVAKQIDLLFGARVRQANQKAH
jgi:hypothetical protein